MKLKWKRLLGDVTVLSLALVIYFTFIVISIDVIINGGSYSILIETNRFYEHWPEIVIFTIGIYFFVRNIKLDNYYEADKWDLVNDIFDEEI